MFDLNFLCIGATKCGTTWLHSVLSEHPDINTSINKEPCYFSQNYSLGIEWYRKSWINKPGIKGEFTNHYVYDERSLERIISDFPNIKLIILLRNPRERSISHYKMIKRSSPNLEDSNLFKSYPKIINRSYYCKYLEKVFFLFDKKNIFIGYYDEILENPKLLLSNILQFLGINDKIIPDKYTNIVGASYKPKYYIFENIKVLIHDLLVRLNMFKTIFLLRKLKITRFFNTLNNDKKSSINVPLNDFNQYNQLFINDLKQLEIMDILNKKYIDKWISSISESKERKK